MTKKVLAAVAAFGLMSTATVANAATLSLDTANAAGTTSIAALGNWDPSPNPTSPPLDPNETLYIFNDTTQGFGLNVNIGAGEPGAVLTYTFLGYEASFDNRSFEPTGTQSFSNQNAATVGTSAAQVELCSGALTSCLADFKFTSEHGGTTYEAENGGPMDNFGPTAPLQIAFGYLSATSVLVFFDDGGAGSDRDFDDMVLQITVRAANTSEVPLPAPMLLLLSGLLGLGFLGRWKAKASAA